MQTPYQIWEPSYRTDGQSFQPPAAGQGLWRDERLEIRQNITPRGQGIIYLERTYLNRTDAPLNLQFEIQVRAQFAYSHYVMPCVLYNGNDWGSGLEPKGLTRDGASWVFDARRGGVPGCTLSENDETALALFASDESEETLDCAASMEQEEDGCMVHRLIYPMGEGPVSYIYRDQYGPALNRSIELAPGQARRAAAYLWAGAPKWPNFGMAGALEAAMAVLKPFDLPSMPFERVWRLGLSFARRLVYNFQGGPLFCIGLDRNDFQQLPHFELGWCGQNALFARMMLESFALDGDDSALALGLAVLDHWVRDARLENGLIKVHFEKPDGALDVCNLGFGAAELLRAHALLTGLGIERPDYRSVGLGICDFLSGHFDSRNGFGKSYGKNGRALETGGTIGAFAVLGLLEAYRQTREARYLEIAERGFAFYVNRDLSQFMTTAGALDTVCVDKETSGPMLMAAMELYALTQNPSYLESAQQAGVYFCSWMFHYEAPYPPESDFKRYGFHTTGSTAVSTQHHHLDPWGALVAPAMLRLYQAGCGEVWLKRAKMLWRGALQCVTPEGGAMVRGKWRPEGSQNEAYMHCRWYNTAAPCPPGSMNDWLVAWPAAFRLYAVSELRKMGVGEL